MHAAEARTAPSRFETWLSVLAMAAMALLPILEIVSRKFLGRGLPGTAPMVQHLTLTEDVARQTVDHGLTRRHGSGIHDRRRQNIRHGKNSGLD